MTTSSFTRAYPIRDVHLPVTGLWFAINPQGQIAVHGSITDPDLRMPHGNAPWDGFVPNGSTIHLGDLNGLACLACALDEDMPLPAEHRALGLRELFGRIDDDAYGIAGYATQMVAWQSSTRFCPRCGTPLEPIYGDWGKKCPRDGHTLYPPVSPCTITLIHDGERILMAHKQGWGARFGLVAGFVEPGETLEENVVREIHEETGVSVTDITYWRSQSWPFPHQIMCGFFARYAGGEVKIDANELDDARWFTARDIRSGTPAIPPPLSISRWLIDHWLAGQP